jgi:DNA-binding winged helix-turn-helix (wHTH) protein/Tol biopolymer transport system component
MRYSFDEFVLDCHQRVLWAGSEIVPLSPKVFETLRVLVLSGGRIVTKQEFIDALWPDSFVEDGNLTQNIFILRKVLGSAGDGQSYIETVPRRGYRFTREVSPEGTAPPDPSSGLAGVPGLDAQPKPSRRDLAKAAMASTQKAANDSVVQQVARQSIRRWTRFRRVAILCFVALMVLGYFRSQATIRVGKFQRLTNDGKSKDRIAPPPAIVTDGTSIFFTETDGFQTLLVRVPERGGEPLYSKAPWTTANLVGLQPDSRHLLFANWLPGSDSKLLDLNPSTGAETSILNIDAQDANWSPDGKELAYAQLGKLFVRAVDGTTSLVASVEGEAYWIRWSPDGRVIRFSQTYQGFHDRLWEVNRKGENLHPLFANQEDEDHACCGTWTKSGRAFVYLSVQANNNSIRIRPENPALWGQWDRKPVDIPAAPLDKWAAPTPSLDGKHIFAIGEQLRGQLMTIDPFTHRPKPFLNGLSAEGVSFSPDGKEIAWTAYPEGTLWRSRSDGSGRVQLTQAPLLARFPHWSPDGSSIVFTAARPGSDWQLYMVPALGGEVKPLLHENNGQGVPTWSPDGKQIAFGHTANGAGVTVPFVIELLRLGEQHTTLVPFSNGLWTARWSPNGRYLSAVTTDNQLLKLYDTQTKGWTDLAHVSVNDVAWSPDGEFLFFDNDSPADPLLYRLRLSDRKLETWADLKNLRRAGFFAPWLGMSPDGSPMFLEDASIQELYSLAVNLP